MHRFLLVSMVAIGLAAMACGPAAAQQTKTAAQCNADYAANKPAIKAAKIKKKDFVASCRAGNEAIPGAGAPPPAQTAAPAPTPAAPPPGAEPAPKPGFFGRKKTAPAPAQTATPAPAPAGPTAPVGANQFQAEGQAQSRCPGALVVWVNTKSGIYHFPGTKNYGNTKQGAYMCESDAAAVGDRASKTEKHP
jgi:hypothetical protein